MDDYQKSPIVCYECSKPITDVKDSGCKLFISYDLERIRSTIIEDVIKSTIIEAVKEEVDKEGNIYCLPSGVKFYGYICKDCLNKKGMMEHD